MGKLLIGAGVLIALVGLLVHFGWMRWFGHLPGDLRYEGGSARVYVPLTSMLIVSVVSSLLLALARKLA